jgi:hypothetical protein
MRYRITAWGSDEHPDIFDEETDIYPTDLLRKYPFVNAAILTPVCLEDLLNSLDALG